MAFLSILLLVLVHAVPSIAGGLPVELAGVRAELARLPAALDPLPAALGPMPAALGPLPIDLGPLPADLRLPADLEARAPAMAALFMADSASTSPTSPGRLPPTVDVCQPVVAVPGFEPQWDVRGRRTELFLSMLARMDLGAPSSVARWVALTGVTVDYRIPDRTQALQFNVFWRWRIE
jgi:hypothetical protein